MASTRLPPEVELVFEVMPCNAMRSGQEPGAEAHACSYFREWGRYHSFDYHEDGPPPKPGIVHDSVYVGRAPLLPELLSGCRKAPIMSVGINPNLPGWWPHKRGSLNPSFDDYRQYAHYFRYRAVSKLEIPEVEYDQLVGDADDSPLTGKELPVMADAEGRRTIPVAQAPQKMYEAYQELLDGLARAMGWPTDALVVGEDLSYGNMVACPSAKWLTRPNPTYPTMPVMGQARKDAIVDECFRERRYFLRQLVQSLPAVILIFSQTTANAFVSELESRFTQGQPRPGESLEQLGERHVRVRYGDLPGGEELDARVIFAPHITGNPGEFEPARDRVVAQMVEEAQAGRLVFEPASGHLRRPRGACTLCPSLELGPCDYAEQLQPLVDAPRLLSGERGAVDAGRERRAQDALLEDLSRRLARTDAAAWDGDDETD